MVAHDLNTHLTGLQSFLQLLAETQLDEYENDCLNTASDCARDLRFMLDRLVEGARGEFEGTFRIRSENVDLTERVGATISQFRPLATAKGIDLVFHAKRDTNRVWVDWQKFQRILVNLVSNSIKFTDQGGIRVAISLIEQPPDNQSAIRLEITDSGIGMTEEQVVLAVQPFLQFAPAGYRGGAGLGLAIVKRLVDEFAGKISVSSRFQCGTTIIVTVPCAKQAPCEKLAGL